MISAEASVSRCSRACLSLQADFGLKARKIAEDRAIAARPARHLHERPSLPQYRLDNEVVPFPAWPT